MYGNRKLFYNKFKHETTLYKFNGWEKVISDMKWAYSVQMHLCQEVTSERLANEKAKHLDIFINTWFLTNLNFQESSFIISFKKNGSKQRAIPKIK